MSRYLVIGNGFDIAHNLHTQYIDFLYLCSKIIGSNDVEYKIEDKARKEKKEESMNSLISEFRKKYEYDKVIDLIRDNKWIKYFIKRYHAIGEGWIDFEKEIKNVCDNYLHDKNINGDTGNYEIFGYDYTNEAWSKNAKSIMKESLSNLVNIFNKYLLIQPYEYCNVYFQQIISFNPNAIINFNYTNTFNKIYYDLNVDYIHGKMDDRNNSIVLGFDSFENDAEDIEFGEFIKYFQMVEKDIEISSYVKLQQSQYNKVMIMGHSLDKTDSDIIKTIIEHSDDVEILYFDPKHKNQMIKNLIDIFGKNEFIKMTLSNEKRIRFVEQLKGKELTKADKELFKETLYKIKKFDFKSSEPHDLKILLNNDFFIINDKLLEELNSKLLSKKVQIGSGTNKYREYELLLYK